MRRMPREAKPLWRSLRRTICRAWWLEQCRWPAAAPRPLSILTPQAPREFRPPVDRRAMDQVQMTFAPRILLVRTGQTTEFWNEVGCDIHPAMVATVIAASTPYATLTDLEGRFVFEQVSPGAYTATVYAGALRIERPVDITRGRTELSLPPE